MSRSWPRRRQSAYGPLARRGRARPTAVLLVALALAWLSGCQPRPEQTRTAGPTTVPIPPTATPVPQPTAAPATTGQVVLTWWTPDFFSPTAPGASGPLLSRYLHEFETTGNGRVRVNPVVKARYGRGGLLDLMSAAQPVVPEILPDLVALDLADLTPAAAAGLLQPLDAIVDPALLTNLYPFAHQAGQYSGRLLAVPFAADIEHVIYNRDRVKVPPVTWADLYAGKVTYLFPTGSPQLAAAGDPAETLQRTFISQYLSAGGSIIPATRRLYLDENVLQRVLTLYGEAKAQHILPASILDMTNLDDCWQAYSADTVMMADVSARRYLAGRDSLKNTGFAPLPGWNGPAVPVASGWALAIVTTDPVRQRAAAELISWLLAPERLTAWSQAAGWLPAAPRAWAGWGSSPYFEFLQGQMAVAVARPAGLGDPQAAGQVQKAIESVLRDDIAPADAAASVFTPVPQ